MSDNPVPTSIAGRLAGNPTGRVIGQSVVALGLVALASLLTDMAAEVVDLPSKSIVFVPVVLGVAIFWGMVPALIATLAAVFAGSFFFYPPILSLHVDNPQELIDLVVFSCVAIACSQLAEMARRAIRAADDRTGMMRDLLAFSRRIADVVDIADLPAVLADGIARLTGRSVVLFVPDGEGLREVARCGDCGREMPERLVEGALQGAVTPGCHVLRDGREVNGVVVLLSLPENDAVDPILLAALLEQTGAALVHMRLAAALEETRVAARAENLREAVLGSISHDLQTPLASILGAATTLEAFGARCTEAMRGELLASIRAGAQRLERHIARMLDLTRVRAGQLAPHVEAVDVADVTGAALRHAGDALAGHPVEVEVPDDLPMVMTDPVLVEQAVVNILENAGKYAPPGTQVRLSARLDGPEVIVAIRDAGIGLHRDDIERVFAPFYRADRESGQLSGTGLGLMISRAFVEAAGGRIWAESEGPGRGATFCIALRRTDGEADLAGAGEA
jgi:two-component system sensor histidine kinase KdpD